MQNWHTFTPSDFELAFHRITFNEVADMSVEKRKLSEKEIDDIVTD